MAVLPTPEENARKILAIFKRNSRRAGEILVFGAINVQAQNVDLDRQDIISALEAAGERGWIENGSNDTIQLTEAGYAEM